MLETPNLPSGSIPRESRKRKTIDYCEGESDKSKSWDEIVGVARNRGKRKVPTSGVVNGKASMVKPSAAPLSSCMGGKAHEAPASQSESPTKNTQSTPRKRNKKGDAGYESNPGEKRARRYVPISTMGSPSVGYILCMYNANLCLPQFPRTCAPVVP